MDDIKRKERGYSDSLTHTHSPKHTHGIHTLIISLSLSLTHSISPNTHTKTHGTHTFIFSLSLPQTHTRTRTHSISPNTL